MREIGARPDAGAAEEPRQLGETSFGRTGTALGRQPIEYLVDVAQCERLAGGRNVLRRSLNEIPPDADLALRQRAAEVQRGQHRLVPARRTQGLGEDVDFFRFLGGRADLLHRFHQASEVHASL